MLCIEQIQDTETLRYVALLLDRECQKLQERIKKLVEENARLRGEDASRVQLELEFLRELLAQRKQALFGVSSEKRARPDTEEAAAPERAPRRGHGPKAQPRLPVVDRIHELDEAERLCLKRAGVSSRRSQGGSRTPRK